MKMPKSLLNLIDEALLTAKKSNWLFSIDSERLLLPPLSDANKTRCPVRIATNLHKKPIHSGTDENPFLPPFDDGALVTEISETHNLLLNRFNLVPRHVLVTTKEFEDQAEGLTLRDFEATWKVVVEVDGLAFFNSGDVAGASQPHKHVQVIPRMDGEHRYPVDDWLAEYSISDLDEPFFQLPYFDFQHGFRALNTKEEKSALFVYKLYQIFIKQWPTYPGYNLLFTPDWFFFARRSRGFLEAQSEGTAAVKLSVNGVGYTGSFFVKTKEQLTALEKLGPLEFLKGVSFPQNDNGIIHEKGKSGRFVYNGGDSYVEYSISGKELHLLHTYTDPQKRGRNLAAKVVDAAFHYAIANEFVVIPVCTYIPVFVKKNPKMKKYCRL